MCHRTLAGRRRGGRLREGPLDGVAPVPGPASPADDILARVHCETTSDPAAFWEAAGAFLLADPVLNNVLVTTVPGRRSGAVTGAAEATFTAVPDGGGTVD